MNRFKQLFKRGLIVSCQALEGEPLYRPEGGIMCLMAKAAEDNGAVGIRCNGLTDTKQIGETVKIPMIAIFKRSYDDAEVYITSTMAEIDELMTIESVKCVAIDCTKGTRHNNENLDDFIKKVKEKYPDLVIMADCSTYEEAMHAVSLNVDAVSTTMSSYTNWTKGTKIPDVTMIEKLVESLKDTDIPVLAEGGIAVEQDIYDVFKAGAYACIVGGAITRPQQITKRFNSWTIKALQE